jgi:hypothetical protein
LDLYPHPISPNRATFPASGRTGTGGSVFGLAWLKKPLPTALLLVLVWTGWRLAVLDHSGIPAPVHVDEFSYLLGADTFAHGRLANPQHPLAKFFESPHILVRPTYASKYPPGQAMFLALGQRVFGSPFYGVLLGNALMIFTICLALFAWVPPRWALAVSCMFCLCLRPTMYWTDSYWGGSVAASGGALVLLGVGLYRKRQTAGAAAIFAIGALLLFWTRPYEGGVFTVAVLMVFGKELWRARRAGALSIALSLLLIGAAWTCLDNKAVTGNAFRLPYFEYVRQYNYAPELWILPLRPLPAYTHPRLLAYWGPGGGEASTYLAYRPVWMAVARGAFLALANLTLWPALLLILLFPFGRKTELFRKMGFVAGIVFLALSLESFHFEHYSAPVWATIGVLIAAWAERAWTFRAWGIPVGKALVLLALSSPAIDSLANRVVAMKVDVFRPPQSMGPPDCGNRREALIKRLSALDRRQLVIVRYPSPGWKIFEEWVENDADIDHERVVFAHDFGAEENRDLLRYYPERTAWLLTFDTATAQEHIEPYP